MTNPSPNEAASATAPAKKSTTTRNVVLATVALATLFILALGASWTYYHLHHTVISNAAVKGRIYQIGARIDGQVSTVEVQPGQRVEKGQLLVQLVDDSYQAGLREAQAALQSASKKLDAEKLAIEYERRRLTLDVERTANLNRAAAGQTNASLSACEKWEREYNRMAALVKAGVASASEMDNAQAERDNARALADVAKENLAATDSNHQLAVLAVESLRVREAGLAVLAANVELARQQVASREADVAAAVIRAPGDGWVVARIVEPGGSAKIGEPMLSLWIGAPWVEAWVDEKDLRLIKIGSPVDVTLTAFPNKKIKGHVEAIGVLADKEMGGAPVPTTLHSLFPENAMIPIRIAVANDRLQIQPGLSALVGISNPSRSTVAKVAGQDARFLATTPPLYLTGKQ